MAIFLGQMSEVSQFVVVDRVYERLRHEEVMLYQPLVVALRQKPLAVTYPLSHLFVSHIHKPSRLGLFEETYK